MSPFNLWGSAVSGCCARKESNGVAKNWPQPDHLWIGRNCGNSGNLSDAARMTTVCATTSPELRIPRHCSSNVNSLCWRVLAEPAGIITTSQIHDSRADSRVQILPPRHVAQKNVLLAARLEADIRDEQPGMEMGCPASAM